MEDPTTGQQRSRRNYYYKERARMILRSVTHNNAKKDRTPQRIKAVLLMEKDNEVI